MPASFLPVNGWLGFPRSSGISKVQSLAFCQGDGSFDKTMKSKANPLKISGTIIAKNQEPMENELK
jgi:hypothetical protein